MQSTFANSGPLWGQDAVPAGEPRPVRRKIIVPASPSPAGFTGERYVSSEGGIIRAEHYHRYLFARSLCEGKRVLDVASGEGYGAALLGQVASYVIGVEVEDDAVRRAKDVYGSSTVEFRQGMAQSLPLEDQSVDVVVSFETLEHFAEQEDFLSECRRVLRPTGMLVVSTPDRPVYSPPSAPPNPFHVKELDRKEFSTLLAAQFPHVQIIVQTPVIGSLIVSGDGDVSAREFYDEGDDRHAFSLGTSPSHPMYLIGVASPAPLPDFTSLLNLYPSAEADRAGFAKEMARLAQAEAGYRLALEDRDATIARIYPFEAECVRLNGEVRLRDGEIVRLTGELAVASNTRGAVEERFRAAIADAAELPVARAREQSLVAALSEALNIRWTLEGRIRDLEGERERLVADIRDLEGEKERLLTIIRDMSSAVERQGSEIAGLRKAIEASTVEMGSLVASRQEAEKALDAARSEADRLRAAAAEIEQLRAKLASARFEIDALDRRAAELDRVNRQTELDALEIGSMRLEVTQLKSDLRAVREEGANREADRMEEIGQLSRELHSVHVVQHEVLSSTTWKLARTMATLGGFMPKPLRGVVRASLRTAARAIRNGSTTTVAAETEDKSGLVPGAPTLAAPESPLLDDAATLKTGLRLTTSLYSSPAELERFDLIIVCDDGQLDSELLVDLEALAIDVTVILTGRRPPAVSRCHRVPNNGGDLVAHLDRLIRASTSPNVVIASGLQQLDIGALHRLGRVFIERPATAAVCGMVLAPDGSVAAAGSELIEGLLRPYAAGADPDAYEIASVAERPQLWPALVAFDSDLYASFGGLKHGVSWPTATADFCLCAQQRGFSVACNPLVKGMAAGGGSAWVTDIGTDVTSAIPSPTRKVLFTDGLTPTPDKDSGSQDIAWLMRIFVEWGWTVTFLPTGNLRHAGRYTDDLRQLGILCPLAPAFDTPWKFIQNHTADIDLAIIHRVTSACHVIEPLRSSAPLAKVLFNTVDLHHVREKRMAVASGHQDEMENAVLTEKMERDLMRRSDVTVLLSRYEYDLVGELEPEVDRYLLPIIRSVPGRTRGVEGRRGALFVGGFAHAPNVDAALHLCRDLWPEVRRLRPEARLTIVGSNPPPVVMALNDPAGGVCVLGYVTDLTELYNETRVNLAPLRVGAGIKGKVVAGLAVGLPTLGSSVALEGMGLEDGKDVLMADRADDFARSFANIDSDDDLWLRLSDAGIATAQREFSVDAAAGRLEDLLRRFDLPAKLEKAA